MKYNQVNSTNLNVRELIIDVASSYIFPAVMSWIPGWLLNNSDLQRASFTTIAIPSCIAAFLSFILLWRMQVYQIRLLNRLTRTIILVIIMSIIFTFVAWCIGLKSEILNIVSSAAIGTAITTWRKPFIRQEELKQ